MLNPLSGVLQASRFQMSEEPRKSSGVLPCWAEETGAEVPTTGKKLVWIILAIIFIVEVVAMVWFSGIFKGHPKAKADDKSAGAAQVHER